MSSQTVTAKGRITLKPDVLRHLGVKPGDRIDLHKLPGGELLVRAARPAGRIDAFLGMLAGKSKKVATIEEINEGAPPSEARRLNAMQRWLARAGTGHDCTADVSCAPTEAP